MLHAPNSFISTLAEINFHRTLIERLLVQECQLGLENLLNHLWF